MEIETPCMDFRATTASAKNKTNLSKRASYRLSGTNQGMMGFR